MITATGHKPYTVRDDSDYASIARAYSYLTNPLWNVNMPGISAQTVRAARARQLEPIPFAAGRVGQARAA